MSSLSVEPIEPSQPPQEVQPAAPLPKAHLKLNKPLDDEGSDLPMDKKSKHKSKTEEQAAPVLVDKPADSPFFGYGTKRASRETDDQDKLEDVYIKKTLQKVKTDEQIVSSAEEAQTEEELLCAVCFTIRSKITAVLKDCGHKFCMACINQTKDRRCPICRMPYDPVADISEDMEYKEKFDKLPVRVQEGGKELIVTAEDLRKKTSVGMTAQVESSFQPNLDMVPKKNLHTFSCPCCPLKHLDRSGLVEHVLLMHPRQRAVCPICSSHAWGDPNYVTHLAAHLSLRHAYDMNDLVDDDMDEDDVLRHVLELSKEIK